MIIKNKRLQILASISMEDDDVTETHHFASNEEEKLHKCEITEEEEEYENNSTKNSELPVSDDENIGQDEDNNKSTTEGQPENDLPTESNQTDAWEAPPIENDIPKAYTQCSTPKNEMDVFPKPDINNENAILHAKTTNNSDNEDEFVFSWQTPPKPKSKVTSKNTSPIRKKPIFLTQLEEQLARKHRDDPPSLDNSPKEVGYQKIFTSSKRKEIAQVYSQEQVPMVSPSKRLSTKQIYHPVAQKNRRASPSRSPSKLAKLGSLEDDFDPNTACEVIPNRIREMIDLPPESPVLRALCGKSLEVYPLSIYGNVIYDMKRLLSRCVDSNLIGESSYVSCMLENVIDERDQRSVKQDLTLVKLEADLEDAQEKLEARVEKWNKQKEILACQKDVELQELDLKFTEQFHFLQAEWDSEKAANKYNKPSAHLISLRQQAKIFLEAHQFKDADDFAHKIREQEELETKEAIMRMRSAFAQANDKLCEKIEKDRQSIEDSFSKKMESLIKAENSNLYPVKNRIANLTKLKHDFIIAQKHKKPTNTTKTRSQPLHTNYGPIVITSKLKLPPISQSVD